MSAQSSVVAPIAPAAETVPKVKKPRASKKAKSPDAAQAEPKVKKPRASKKAKAAQGQSVADNTGAVAGTVAAPKVKRSRKPKAAVPADGTQPAQGQGEVKVKKPRASKKDKAPKPADVPASEQAPKKRKRNTEGQKITRALSGYVLFASDNWARISQAHPEAKFPDLSRFTAAEWKSLPEDKKAPYLERAAADKSRYLSEKNANKKPASPCNPYILFCNDKRGQVSRELSVGEGDNAHVDMKAVQTKLGNMWKTLPDAERAPYKKRYEDAMAKHKETMAIFKADQEKRAAQLAQAAPVAAA